LLLSFYLPSLPVLPVLPVLIVFIDFSESICDDDGAYVENKHLVLR